MVAGHGGDLHLHRRAVEAQVGFLQQRGALAAFAQAPEALADGGAMLGMDPLQHRPPQQLLRGGGAEQAQGRRIGMDEAGVGTEEDGVRGMVCKQVELGFAHVCIFRPHHSVGTAVVIHAVEMEITSENRAGLRLSAEGHVT